MQSFFVKKQAKTQVFAMLSVILWTVKSNLSHCKRLAFTKATATQKRVYFHSSHNNSTLKPRLKVSVFSTNGTFFYFYAIYLSVFLA